MFFCPQFSLQNAENRKRGLLAPFCYSQFNTLFKKLLATPIFVETSAHSTLYWKNISQFILQSFLKPAIRYELKHGDMLTFGDVKCQYVVDLDTEEVNCYMCTVRLV